MAKNKTIIAVGGGEIGRMAISSDGTSYQTEVETTKIDRFILNSTGKKHPKMLFIGTATNDKQSYLEIITEHFKDRLGCQSVEPLNLVTEKLSFEHIREKIFNADVIYVGGGDTTTMLQIWRKQGVDKLLYKAWQKGIVMAGISAGAICWFEYYDNMDDIDSLEDLDIISGLGFVKGFGVPHYNQLSTEEKTLINLKLKEKNLAGWSIDDCSALVFQDDNIQIISCKTNRNVHKIP